MSPHDPSRRNMAALEAIDPVHGRVMSVYVAHERIRSMGNRGMVLAREFAFLVPEILRGPTAIFEGIRLEADEDRGSASDGWRCYCGIPSRRFRKDGTETAPYVNQVFLVFVNADHVVYCWRWEAADEANDRLVNHHQSRFKERLL